MNTQEIIINARNSEKFREKVYALKSSVKSTDCIDLNIHSDLCYKNILHRECKKFREQSSSFSSKTPSLQLHDVLEYKLYNLLCSLLYKK